MSDKRPTPVPDWLVERLAKDELPAAQAKAVAERLAAEGGPDRREALAASDREILAAHPAAEVAAEVQRRLALAEARAARAKAPRARAWILSGALAASAGAFALVMIARQPPPPEEIGIKGPARLMLFRKAGPEGQQAEKLGDGASVRAGDTLQVAYRSGGKRYGVVASVDARGTVTLHLPETPGPAPRLGEARQTPLPHAFELDDSPGFERFVFVTSDTPFSTSTVVESLKPSGQPLPAGLETIDLTLRKATP